MRLAPTPGTLDLLFLVAPPFSNRDEPHESTPGPYMVAAREAYQPGAIRAASFVAGSVAAQAFSD